MLKVVVVIRVLGVKEKKEADEKKVDLESIFAWISILNDLEYLELDFLGEQYVLII